MRAFHRIQFYLLLLFLPTQLGYHFWPSWALVLGRRVDYLSPTLFLTDILILLLLFFWFIEKFPRITTRLAGGWVYNLRFTKKNILSLFLFLFVVINIWFSVSRIVAMYTWVKFLEFFLLGLYIAKTKPDFKRVIFFLSIGVLYSSVLAIAQFALQHSVGGPLWLLGERTFTAGTPGIAQIPLCMLGQPSCPLYLRAYATFPHPNVLGGYLAVILPLVLWQLLKGKNQQIKLYYGITILLGLVALLLTFSRSAWAVGIIAIAIVIGRIKNYELGIMNSAKRRIATLLFLSCVVILVSYFIIHYSTEESVVTRVLLSQSAVNIWKQSPWLGVGLGNFLVALPRYLPSHTIYFLQPVHNVYLLLLSEVGLVGVGLLLYIIIKHLNHELRIKNHEKCNNSFSFTIRYSLFTILILGLIDHYPLTLQQGRLIVTILIAISLIKP
jgi:hypothetical protein